MRLLLVIEACSGGAGRHVIDLASGMLARGHEVSLIYSPRRAEKWFVDEIKLLDRLSIHELPMNRSVGINDFTKYRELKQLIEKIGPFDILHGHSSKAGALLRLAQARSDIPVVYTPHAPITMDPELSVPVRLAYFVVERLLMGLCDRVICVSPAERDHFLSLRFSAEKLRVVCNGIRPLADTDRAAIRRHLNFDADTVCFGFVGRISHQKAVERAIEAFALTYRQVGNTRLVVVGNGPELAAMKTLAADLGVGRQVTFTGAANGAEFMAAFDVFVLPSRYEGLPYVLLEAAVNGLPTVMTDVGGAHLVVRHGENGFVLPQMQIELLVDRLLLLAQDSDLRRAMSIRATEIAAAFSLDNMVDETLSVYAELSSSPAVSSR